MLTARARELTPSHRRPSLFDSSLTGSSSSKQQAAGGLGSKPAPDYKVDLTRYTLARLYEKSSGWMGMGGSSSQVSHWCVWVSHRLPLTNLNTQCMCACIIRLT